MRGPKPKLKPSPASTNGRDDSGRFRRGQAPKPKPKPPLVVERVGLHTLHEDPANPNTHPENDIKDLQAKLATFGQVEPLVVQKSTRKVIGGNGRLEAMRRLGWVQCDVTFIDCDNVTATALGISLNRRKSLMDDSALVAQLQAIQSENADLMDAVGYDQGEIDALIAGLKRDVDNGALADAIGGLPDGEKSPFQQMTFTVSDGQAATITQALDAAKKAGATDTSNENSNGNALALIATRYLGGR